jgi:hypothetical protein
VGGGVDGRANLEDDGPGVIDARGGRMGKKVKYSIRYRSDAAPRGSFVTEFVDAESESEAIAHVRKKHPKATEIVAKPK